MKAKLAVEFLGFYTSKSGKEMALYHATKGRKSAVDAYRESQGDWFSLSKQGFPLFSTTKYFGDVGIISSYTRQDGSVGFGPDLTDLKKLRSLSELLGTDFVSQILGREFDLPDIRPDSDESESSSESDDSDE